MPTDSNTTVSLLSHLYSTGAFLCLGIVVAYLALKYASTRVAWLEVPGRSHWVTLALTVLAIFALPATQGTTPNTSMFMTAAATLFALLLPGAPKSTGGGDVVLPMSGTVSQPVVAQPIPSLAPKGFARFDVMMWLAGIGGAAMALSFAFCGCGWFRGTVEPDAQAVFDCAKTQATAAAVEDIVATFVSAVASGNVSSAAEALALKYGAPLVACSLAAIEGSGSGSAKKAVDDPVVLAAHATLASHGWRVK